MGLKSIIDNRVRNPTCQIEIMAKFPIQLSDVGNNAEGTRQAEREIMYDFDAEHCNTVMKLTGDDEDGTVV